METAQGTYALLMRSQTSAEVRPGRAPPIAVQPGYYVYVGSAFGPGGVRARVRRHCRETKARHWHIDYLTGHALPLGAWYSHAPERLEHRWAALLPRLPGMTPVSEFGCSDCDCDTHLFYSADAPDIRAFTRIAGVDVGVWTRSDIGPRMA